MAFTLPPTEHIENPKLLSPLTLAFIGDAVFEILVRERLVAQGNAPVNVLHRHAVRHVSAASQSRAIEALLPVLTEAETEMYKRGRNANGNVPKSASPQEYRRATGLETLFGWLYLMGDLDRIHSLFELAWNEESASDEKETGSPHEAHS